LPTPEDPNVKTTIKTALLSLTATLYVLAPPARAHHSFPAEYDAEKKISLTGQVTKVEWTNPHIFFYMDAKDEKTGAVVNWALEMGSPNSLMRLGWKRDSLKVGDVVTVDGSLAKNGTRLANATTVTVNGKRLFAGSSGGTTAAGQQ
jgi:hypothetical protein